MSKGVFIPELPCEHLVRDICGPQWRGLPDQERDAAWGIAVVWAALNGNYTLNDIANRLGVDREHVFRPYRNLAMNGVFQPGRLAADRRNLERRNQLAWGYYGGYACGATGLIQSRD